MKSEIAIVVLLVVLLVVASYPFLWLSPMAVSTTPPAPLQTPRIAISMRLPDSMLPEEYRPTELAPGEYAARNK